MSRRASHRLRGRAEAFKQDALTVSAQLDIYDGDNDGERQGMKDRIAAYKIINVELRNIADELGRDGL